MTDIIKHRAVARIEDIADMTQGRNTAGHTTGWDALDEVISAAASAAGEAAQRRTVERLSALVDVRNTEKRAQAAEARVGRLEQGIMAAGPGAADVAHERARQMEEEGYHPLNDLHSHEPGRLTDAAVAYARTAIAQLEGETAPTDEWAPPPSWPWGQDTWSPDEEPRRNLEKAGALIAAELDRMALARAQEAIAADDPVPEEATTAAKNLGGRMVKDSPQA